MQISIWQKAGIKDYSYSNITNDQIILKLKIILSCEFGTDTLKTCSFIIAYTIISTKQCPENEIPERNSGGLCWDARVHSWIRLQRGGRPICGLSSKTACQPRKAEAYLYSHSHTHTLPFQCQVTLQRTTVASSPCLICVQLYDHTRTSDTHPYIQRWGKCLYHFALWWHWGV